MNEGVGRVRFKIEQVDCIIGRFYFSQQVTRCRKIKSSNSNSQIQLGPRHTDSLMSQRCWFVPGDGCLHPRAPLPWAPGLVRAHLHFGSARGSQMHVKILLRNFFWDLLLEPSRYVSMWRLVVWFDDFKTCIGSVLWITIAHAGTTGHRWSERRRH